MLKLEQFWDEEDAAPPAKPTDIKRAEKRIGLTLPKSLTAALRLHDGGFVLDEDILILGTNSSDPGNAVNRMTRAYRDDPDVLEALKEQGLDPDQIVAFAVTDDGATTFALSYGSAESVDEPSVVWIDMDNFDCIDSEYTFDQFFQELMKTESEPLVHWEESTEMDLIFEEVIESPDEFEERIEQRVCDAVTSVVVFQRTVVRNQTRLSRCEIMKPLNPDRCLILPTPRDDGQPIYELALTPEVEEMESELGESLADAYETSSVLLNESRQTRAGAWRNQESRDVSPLPVLSSNRKSLQRVRERCLGQVEITERARVHEMWVEKLSEMGETELEQAFPHLMASLFSKLGDLPAPVFESLGPEERRELQATKAMMMQILAEHPGSGSASRLDPELLKLTERLLELDEENSPS